MDLLVDAAVVVESVVGIVFVVEAFVVDRTEEVEIVVGLFSFAVDARVAA